MTNTNKNWQIKYLLETLILGYQVVVVQTDKIIKQLNNSLLP